MSFESLKRKFTDFLSTSSFYQPNRLHESSAWIQHVPFAFWITEQIKPQLFVELGVHAGVSYFAFCQSVKANNLPTLCYGIDTWKGDEHAGVYNEDIWLDVNGINTHLYAPFSYLLRTTFNEALPYFEDKTIDLLHIDGFHTYDAVKGDFENWLPKMSDTGIILFHDIAVREREFGVYKFWTELKQQYKTFEFLHGYGLGVLMLGKGHSDTLNSLFELTDEKEISKIRAAYAGLGFNLTETLRLKKVQQQLQNIDVKYTEVKQHASHVKAQYDYAKLEYEHLKFELEQSRLENELLKQEKEKSTITIDNLTGELQSIKEQLQKENEAFSLSAAELENARKEFLCLKQEMEQQHLQLQQQAKEYQQSYLNLEQALLSSNLKEAELQQALQNEKENLSQIGNLNKELEAEKRKIERLKIELHEQKETIQWFKRTYEDRNLLGIIKDRILISKNSG